LALSGRKTTVAARNQPLDGENILPFLLGQESKNAQRIYLFFDGPYLQTARAGRWKIHLARWNIPRYTAASGQQKNVRLAKPELFDMTIDPGESYDVAARQPGVVAELRARIIGAVRTFPQEIQQANAELLAAQ
jgi:arylsulfatase A